jgi:hypothetical protein
MQRFALSHLTATQATRPPQARRTPIQNAFSRYARPREVSDTNLISKTAKIMPHFLFVDK